MSDQYQIIIIPEDLTLIEKYAPESLDILRSKGALIYEDLSRGFANIAFDNNKDIVLLLDPFVREYSWEELNKILGKYKFKYIFTPYSRTAIDQEQCDNIGICYSNNAGANKNAVAQHCLEQMFMLLRQYNVVHRDNSGDVLGEEFEGKTVGIIGMGSIGKTLTKYLQMLGLNVFFYNRSEVKDPEFAGRQKEFDEVMKQDIIFVTIATTPETRKLFGDKFLAQLENKYLIDISSIDDLYSKETVIEFTQNGILKGYSFETDNPEKYPHAERGNIQVTPHIAWLTTQALRNCYNGWLQMAIEVIENTSEKL